MRKSLFIPFISLAIILSGQVGCSHRQPEFKIGVSQCLDDAWRQKMNEEMERELLLYPNMDISHHRIAAAGLSEIVHHSRMGYAVPPEPTEIAAAISDYYLGGRQAAFTEYLILEKDKYAWSRMTDTFLRLLSRQEATI